MALRFSEIDLTVSGARDFVIRRRFPTFAQLLMILGAILLFIIAVVFAAREKTVMLLVLLSFMTLVGWYVILLIQRSRDTVLATEFQNALFASALGLNNMFCLIIRRDGNVIYLDRSFQDMFPDFLSQPRHTIDMLLTLGRVAKDESGKIFSAIESGTYDKVVFDIRDSKGRFHKIMMSIEPIMRPAGFILLRGREYVERTAQETANGPPNPLSRSTITLFSHVMDSMDMGVYMAGPGGNVIYVNPVLEQWLGFAEGEMGTKSLLLSDIAFSGANPAQSLVAADFQGEVLLKRKSGSMLKTFINQKTILDPHQKIIGYTALVHHYTDQNKEEKKQQW